MTTVRDVMRPSRAVSRPGETMREAACTMRDSAVRMLPLCDRDDRLTGVLTDRDLVVRGIAEGCDPHTTRAAALATVPVIAVSVSAPAERALSQMLDHRLRLLPVVGPGGRLVGVVTQEDVALALTDLAVDGVVTAFLSRRESR